MSLDRTARGTLAALLEDGTVETDLGADALAGKVAALRPRLVEAARAGETVGYAEVTDGFSLVHGARVGAVLAAVGHLEAESGRPFLPGVVVERDAELPGEWYFEMLERSDAFDERTPADPGGRRAVWSTQVLDVWQYAWDRDGTA